MSVGIAARMSLHLKPRTSDEHLDFLVISAIIGRRLYKKLLRSVTCGGFTHAGEPRAGVSKAVGHRWSDSLVPFSAQCLGAGRAESGKMCHQENIMHHDRPG